MFTVIIPLYNKEKDISSTLDSVLMQSFCKFKVIIINDGSTDKSLKVLKKYDDPRIKIISKKNEGVSIARNIGVLNATNKYVAFLDADDYWYPNHLENMYNLINKYPNENWFSTAYEIKHGNNLTLQMKSPAMKNKEEFQIINYFEHSLIDAIAWTSAVCMNKDFFTKIKGFDERLTNGQDTDLWIRAGIAAPLAFSKKITAQYIQTTSNRISTKKTTEKTIINFSKYEVYSKTTPFLKQYLDLNRYSIAIRFKKENNKSFVNHLIGIDYKNLTTKQRLLLKLPNKLVITLFKIQDLCLRVGFRFRTS